MAGTHAVMENKYNHVTPGKVVRIIVLIALLLFPGGTSAVADLTGVQRSQGRHVRRALPHPR